MFVFREHFDVLIIVLYSVCKKYYLNFIHAEMSLFLILCICYLTLGFHERRTL